MNRSFLVIASFLASSIEGIEMMAIVLGVGVTRGWRATLIGAAAGVAVLAGLIVALGAALTSIPISSLRLVVGGLLLIFGLQWLRKGLIRIAVPAPAAAADEDQGPGAVRPARDGFDWYAFVVAFKGVVLEGLEVAFIVVTFGAAAHEIWLAGLGAAAALAVVVGIGIVVRGVLGRIPRPWLRFAVGILLTTFGIFWAAEGVGVEWPLEDGSILWVLGLVTAVGFALLELLRRERAPGRHAPRRTPA